MNAMTATPLQEILAHLESMTTALRSQDEDRGRSLLARTLNLLRSRPLDYCDRMTIRIVLFRIQRAGGRTMAQAVESFLAIS